MRASMDSVLHRLVAIALTGAALSSCQGSSQTPGHLIAQATFHTASGIVRTEFLSVADSPDERARGLMNRSSLRKDSGMLFVFDEPTTEAFWMKDTDIPLSIGFIGKDDRVVDLMDMEPCAAGPCRLYTSRDAYIAAVEMNQGWFK